MGRKPLLSANDVLDAINRWLISHSVAPTVEELRRELGLGSTRTVLRYLRELEDSGQIRRWAGARGIQPLKTRTGKGVQTASVPLLGEAPAGPLMWAEQSFQGYLRLPQDYLRGSSGKFFLLRVRGDSMNRAKVAGQAIENGDLVLVRQQAIADSSDIIVALVDGEATIKRLVKGHGHYLLKPESTNPKHQPIMLESDFRVQGVVCRVIKHGSVLLDEG